MLTDNLLLYPEYPDPKMDSRDYIWKREFLVRIPRTDTYGEGYLKAMGVPVSTDERLDRIMRDEVITTYKTIDGMVEIFRNGGRINVVGVSNCSKIYRYIDNHLETWKRHLERSIINFNAAPVDDLLLLDEFAGLVFDYARWDHVDDNAIAFLRRQFGAQYRHTVAAIQEAIPTMTSIKNKSINKKLKDEGTGIRLAEANEISSPELDPMDAFNFRRDLHAQNERDIENKLPKRYSYAEFFEQFRIDKSITKLAPTIDQRFAVPNHASFSLSNRLGKGT